MKICTEFEALLDLYVDGELSPEEMGRVADHLDQCEACRSYVDDALAIRAAFPQAEDLELPEGFTESVMEAVRQAPQLAPPERELRNTHRWVRTFASLAAACFVLAVALRALPMGGGGDSGSMESFVFTASAPSGADAPADTAAPAEAEDTAEADILEFAEFAPQSAESQEELDRRKLPGETSGIDTGGFSAAPESPLQYEAASNVQNGASQPTQGPAEDSSEVKEEISAAPPAAFRTTIPADQADLLADYASQTGASGETVWQLTAEQYQQLAQALTQRGVEIPLLPEGEEVIWIYLD